jgi:putative FmdB family regulatory protein
MPTYEFKCPQGHVFEKVYSTISKTRRLKCPKCGKMGERLISGGAGLVFKGSGFYETDYKRAGKKADTETKADTKAETKAADTKPPKKDSSSDK